MITIKKVAPAPVRTFNINNFTSFRTELKTPVSVLPLPETSASQAEALKIEGNILQFVINWVVRDNDTPVVEDATIDTAMEIYDFLIDTFQNKGSLYAYEISVSGSVFVQDLGGVVVDVALPVAQKTPLTFDASLTFQVANVITVVEVGG